MMKQYMKNKSLFLQKEELLSRIAELFSKKILRPSGVLVFLLIAVSYTHLTLPTKLEV